MLSKLRPVGERFALKSAAAPDELFAPLHSFWCGSGTSALALALHAAKLRSPDRSQVLVPAYTCPDVISACLAAEVEPVLVDFAEESAGLSLAGVSQAINSKTLAIIAINFLGIPERIASLRELIDGSPILIIEDSAQGIPRQNVAEYWQGDLITLSLGRGKPLNLFAGGAVLTRDASLQDILQSITPQWHSESALPYQIKYQLSQLLMRPLGFGLLNRIPGIEFGQTVFRPLPEVSAFPEYLSQYLALRLADYQAIQSMALVTEYREGIAQLSNQIMPLAGVVEHAENLLRMPLIVATPSLRDKIFSLLEAQGLGPSIMYRKTLTEFSDIPLSLGKASSFPNACKLAQRLLTLPLHRDVKPDAIKQMLAIIQQETTSVPLADK